MTDAQHGGDGRLVAALRPPQRLAASLSRWLVPAPPTAPTDDAARYLEVVGQEARRSVRRGWWIVGGLAGVFFFWSVVATLEGAVISQGTVVVDDSARKIQHQEGGIVKAIHVRNGDKVATGQPLLSLDDTAVRANLAIFERQLVDLAAREARLRAEMANEETIGAPRWPTAPYLEEQRRTVLIGEQSLLTARQLGQRARISQLAERRGQLKELVDGLIAQQKSKTDEIELIDRELVGLKGLFQRGLAAIQRVTALERERARLVGEAGRFVAELARTRGQMSEIDIQISEAEERYRSDLLNELRTTEGRIAELEERRIAIEDRLNRIVVLAPIAGTVHQSEVNTVGGVVNPSQVLMLVVPDGDPLTIEARIAPIDIEQIFQGQKAYIRLTAFNQRTTPEFPGVVERVSPDIVTDPRSGTQFFTARVRPDAAALGGRVLVPGMPVEAYFRTDSASVMRYLTKPLADNFNRALRER